MSYHNSGTLLFLNLHQSAVLARLWSHISGSDRSLKKADYRDINLEEAITSYVSLTVPLPFTVSAVIINTIARIYQRRLESFETKLSSAISRFEDGMLPSSAVKTSRKRRASETPMASVPEDTAMMFQDEVAFEVPALLPSVARTPVSGRKRLFSTPRRTEDEPAFESTPVLLTPDDGKRRRLSSVSEVMDSLRADDGQRRLSGLLMTANGSMPPSPVAEDLFDAGIDPASPWTSFEDLLPLPPIDGEPQTGSARQRRTLKKRQLTDKRGRWGIEIDPKNVQERREWYLTESEFYIPKQRLDKRVLIPIASVLNDRTSHIAWFIPAPPCKRLPRVVVASTTGAPVELYEESMPDLGDAAFGGEHWSPPEPLIRIHNSTLEERIEQLKSETPLKSILAGPRASRKSVATNFIDILSFASSGKVGLKRTDAQLGFNCASSVLIYREVN